MGTIDMVETDGSIAWDGPLIEVKNLKMYFRIPRKGFLHAVDDVSFSIGEGETLGLVGESGCGKSTVGNVVMRLLKVNSGQLLFQGRNVLESTSQESQEFRRKMQIIFQDPYSSLNPRKTIKSILCEAFVVQRMGRGKTLNKLVADICDQLGIPGNLLDHYPHELDGGMRQVVGIARALSLKPRFIVCDEPVSSLDVSVQARILNLLIDIQREYGLSYLFISHDLSVVRHISKRIAVMYLGQIVEMADVDSMFEWTAHPYSIALLSAVPQINLGKKVSRIVLRGDVPSPMNPKPGCRFAQRCWMARPECAGLDPESREIAPGHFVTCHFAHESRERMLNVKKTSLVDMERDGSNNWKNHA
jgi:oligopeptide/dipeptide ABC transporter ATP-binding protein